ncbi:MAG: hypothetical protein MRZ79_11525 [Bacteroidia bacterium]|nr:hypothetical protein [Bacteroidia bacterium]
MDIVSAEKEMKQMSKKIIFVPIEWESLDNPPEAPSLIPPIVEIPISAASAALITGVQAMMQEAGKSFQDWQNGKIDETQFTYRIIHKGSKGAVKGGVRTAGALGLSQGIKFAVAKKWGEEIAKRLTRHNLLGSICFGLVDQTTDTVNWMNGKLDVRDYKVKSVENVGSTGGAIGGAAVGSVLGSVVPGLGTGAGALIGGMLSMMGAMSGASIAKSLGEEWFPKEEATPKKEK